MLLKTLTVLCLLLASSIAATDYCKLNCGDTKNIACNSAYVSAKDTIFIYLDPFGNWKFNFRPVVTYSWGDSCKAQALFSMTKEYQQSLVDVHNKYRNLIALGNITPYSPAVRMPKIKWDADLAYTAEMNVRSCVYGHDSCHNTAKYSNAGQSIAMMMTVVDWDRNMTTSRLTGLTMGWFNEYKNGKSHGWMDMINQIKASDFDSSKPVVGHFTAWVQDRTEAIGCAAVFTTPNYNGKDYGAFILTCNYSFSNLLGTPVYVAGTTASKCMTGRDATYPGICSENEVITY
ncbi:antigen 5 like allergen Cul n 1-like [Sitodiplosis mosellana]|uniref:antigen 5 like allergen Cul n 1-like n=1 Tax=Sitodiplosis mosellana TaxID=263140 RepID=UPI00244482CB|nr:antigen 5 like allergen Cul n 1-like [Sitodiplosis mosellana]